MKGIGRMDRGYRQQMWLHGLFYAVGGSRASDFFNKVWKNKKVNISATNLEVNATVQIITMPAFISYIFSSLINI